jgi:hypothetical protein
MKRIPRFPQPAGPLDPPDHLTLLFRQRDGPGFRYLVDGEGFVAASAEDATPIPFRSGDRSVLWSRFTADLGGLHAVVPFELLEDGPAAVTARWAGYEWRLPRCGGTIDFTGYQSLLRDIRPTGGPYPAASVLWRDTGELVQFIGITAELVRPPLTPSTRSPAPAPTGSAAGW